MNWASDLRTPPRGAARLAEPDETLATLVPRRSPLRAVLVAVVTLAVLVALWWSPKALRPTVGSPYSSSGPYSSSSASVDTPRPVVVAQTSLVARGWRSVEIVSVADVPGARVVGSWAVPSGSPFGDGQPVTDAATPIEFARETFDGLTLDETTALPHRVDDGEEFLLIVLWEVTDCPSLSESFDTPTFVRISSVVGVDRTVPVEILTPDRPTLVDLGGC